MSVLESTLGIRVEGVLGSMLESVLSSMVDSVVESALGSEKVAREREDSKRAARASIESTEQSSSRSPKDIQASLDRRRKCRMTTRAGHL